MTTVYVLQHESDDEDVKFVGIYSTRQNAETALDRVRTRPGFRDAPTGFTIDPYELDRDGWISGFVREVSGSDEVAEAAA